MNFNLIATKNIKVVNAFMRICGNIFACEDPIYTDVFLFNLVLT